MLYPIAIEKGDDGHAYGVTVPDIPGCFSAGDTLQEAITNAHEGIAGHLELLAEAGEDIPQGSSVDQWLHHPDYAGYIWAIVELDVTPYLGKAEKVNVTLPSRLLASIDKKVGSSAVYKTRSGFLAAAAQQLLARA